MTELPTVECKSWEELFQKLEQLRGWIFRGQCSAQWPLRTTLERRTPTGDLHVYTEFNIVHAFKRAAHNYLRQEQLPDTEGGWLALMQHLGAPTRLLDFTRSPFVAAYFALEEIPADQCTHAAVFAISTDWLQRKVGAGALRGSGLFGVQVEQLHAGISAWRGTVLDSKPALGDDLVAGHLLAGHVEEHAMSHVGDVLSFFDPRRSSERLAAQQGLFLWPGRVDRPIAEILGDREDFTGGIWKFVIPLTERPRAIERFRMMNITRASLFPGLDGFAQSLRYLALRESDEDRKMRAVLRGLEEAAKPTRGYDR
jgi:hypothetical protein